MALGMGAIFTWNIVTGSGDMSIKSDNFEKAIVDNIKINAKHLKVEHTGGNVHLPDINLTSNNDSTFVEVKMTGAQFGTPRLKYEYGAWAGVEDNYITNNISSMLNVDGQVKNIIGTIVDEHSKTYYPLSTPWIGYKRTHYKDFRNHHTGIKVETKDVENMLCYKTIQTVLKYTFQNQTILWNEDSDKLSKIVSDYYIHKGANYLQVGDNFYSLSHSMSDNLGIRDDAPTLSGDVKLTVRFSFRKTHQWIEIIPTIKFFNMKESIYSLKPNSNKKLPFKE